MVRGVASTVEDQEEVKRLNLLGVWPWAGNGDGEPDVVNGPRRHEGGS